MSDSKKERAARKRQLEGKIGRSKKSKTTKKRSKKSKAVPVSSGQYLCPKCAAERGLPWTAPQSDELDLEQFEEECLDKIREMYNWDELVRLHGEEGAAIIADCL
ncbi:MAG: hypothetical protein KDA51_04690 [Planctomycetales bacterium]|nr:hypothetical protein [Planctomycetales bacterium]